MTETSVEFAKLEIALVEASELLKGLPLHDVETRLHQLKLKSYVLLCHAAIEEYLENISLAILKYSIEAFEADNRLPDPLLCACSYYKIQINKEISVRRDGDSLRDLLKRLCHKAIAEHHSAIEQVNGIKTRDQDAILMPIGVRIFDFDRILSQNLNSYGERRGAFAHGSGIQKITPRKAQESTVWNLVLLLQSLDNMLCERYRVAFSFQ